MIIFNRMSAVHIRLFVSILVLNSNIVCMKSFDINEVKKTFESKIDWVSDDSISITMATIPGLLDLTRVKIPEKMREEFESFFQHIDDKKTIEALSCICSAIKASEQRSVVSYTMCQKRWPKSIIAVSDVYVKKSRFLWLSRSFIQ